MTIWKNILASCIGAGLCVAIVVFSLKTRKETADKVVDNTSNILYRIAELRLKKLENQVGDQNA